MRKFSCLRIKKTSMPHIASKFFFSLFFILFFSGLFAQTYAPAPENLDARKEFQQNRFGLFIHWGPFSIPGAGEWVMNNRNISVNNYTRLARFFNPTQFNAAQWVSMAKNAG